jgi:hypothetical protein
MVEYPDPASMIRLGWSQPSIARYTAASAQPNIRFSGPPLQRGPGGGSPTVVARLAARASCASSFRFTPGASPSQDKARLMSSLEVSGEQKCPGATYGGRETAARIARTVRAARLSGLPYIPPPVFRG